MLYYQRTLTRRIVSTQTKMRRNSRFTVEFKSGGRGVDSWWRVASFPVLSGALLGLLSKRERERAAISWLFSMAYHARVTDGRVSNTVSTQHGSTARIG